MQTRWLRLSTTITLIGGSALIGLSTACASMGMPGTAQPNLSAPTGNQVVAISATPTPRSTRAGASKTATVKRDNLTETIALDGLVTAQNQQPVMYAWHAKVDQVDVKPGQLVKQNEVLIDFDATDANRNLDTATAQLQAARANLAKAQAAADAQQQQTAQKAAADEKQRRQAILDAQVTLSRAQDNLRSVQAGPSASARQVANTSVSYYGQTTLAQAQDSLNTIMAGPDPATIQAAQRDQANAQVAAQKAQANLDTLMKGADPGAIRDAQLAVQQAQAQLQAAQSAKPDPRADPSTAQSQHDAAVVQAQITLDKSQQDLARLKAPPSDADVQAAQAKVTDAQATLTATSQKLATLQAGPDQTAIDAAQKQVEYAKHTLAEMQAAADEVNSHPTRQELQAAQDQVRKAQEALDNLTSPQSATPAAPDLSDVQDAVTQAQATYDAAKQAVDATHLRAPFDGVVVSVRAKYGDTVDTTKPLVMLATNNPPVVTIEPDDTQVQRIAVGQKATIDLSADPASPDIVDATVTSITRGSQDGRVSAQAVLQVAWPGGAPPPNFGTAVQANVILDQKDGVLVIPKTALHQLGNKATVEVQDGTLRRVVTVQVGITTPDAVEIASGLNEGQIVLLAASP